MEYHFMPLVDIANNVVLIKRDILYYIAYTHYGTPDENLRKRLHITFVRIEDALIKESKK